MVASQKAFIDRIRKAKSAHIRWRSFAQALVSGVPIDDEKLPLDHTACGFGVWYHGEGKQTLGHLASYDGIYTPHEMLHAIYKRIYDLLNVDDAASKGLLSKMFSNEEGKREIRLKQARELMTEMVGVSDTLLKALEMLEEEVREHFD